MSERASCHRAAGSLARQRCTACAVVRNRRGYRGQRRRLLGDLLGENFGSAAPVEGQPTGKHRVAHHTQRVDIAAPVDVAAAGGLLRRHVLRRPDHAAVLGQGLPFAEALGDAEVGQQSAPRLVVEKNVVRFDVAVHHPLTMGVVETVGDLRENATGFFLGNLPVAAKPVGERFAAYIPHHEVRHAFHFAERVKRDDVRMRQSRRRTRFASESLVHGPLVRSGLDDFDGHFALEGEIARQVDRAHPSPPQQPDQTVLALEFRFQGLPQWITFGFGSHSLFHQAYRAKTLGVIGVDFVSATGTDLPGHITPPYICIKERLSMVTQGLQQIVHLVVDVMRRCDGIRNAPRQGVAVATAETMDGYLDGRRCHVQFASGVGMRSRVIRHDEERSEALEQRLIAGGHVLSAQVLEDGCEQGETPLAIVETLRCLRVRESTLITTLGGDDVDRQCGMTTSALHRQRAVALIEEKVLARRQQKRAKPSAAAVGVTDVALLDQAREESLGEILRFLCGKSLPPNERENRVPVQSAETRQRLLGLCGIALRRGQHQTPPRGGESATAGGLRLGGATGGHGVSGVYRLAVAIPSAA